MKIPTYAEVLPYIEKGLVSEQRHPEDNDVVVLNYTQKTQFEKAWDDITRQCRGLIINVRTGEVLARPFPKFFNYSEHVQNAWPIPNDTPIVTEKLDGSLGILYSLNGKSWIATRGSFMSDQAQWATKWFREAVDTSSDLVVKGQTALFEIIFPENRIVVNYDFAGLVHLATIDIATGLVVEDSWPTPFRKAAEKDVTNIDELMKLDEPNSEGFVVFYPKENVRMKIKFPEYVRLHKIVTGVSEIGIWEMLREGHDLKPLLEKVPDEFFQWVKGVEANLRGQFDEIKSECEKIYEKVRKLPDRKSQAIATLKKSGKYSGIIFTMLDMQSPDKIIWKMIRPHGKSIFKNDIDT